MESCPDGWHLPSDEEWIQLEMNLGMSLSDAYVYGFRGTGIGDKLKATEEWYMEGNGTNESGFTALPGGYRNYDGGNFLVATEIMMEATSRLVLRVIGGLLPKGTPLAHGIGIFMLDIQLCAA